jgi:hypothetical protein
MPPSLASRELVRHLDRLEEESVLRQDETQLSEAETNLRFLRGQQWPATEGPASPYRPEAAQYRFVMNLINQNLKRKVALITDTRPQIDVMPLSAARKKSAELYKKVLTALWDENNFDQLAARELVRAAAIGSTVCVPIWNESALYGRGNVQFNMYDPRQARMDPSIVKTAEVQRLAEYVMIREVLPTNLIKEQYRERGREVTPTARWSRYGRKGNMSGASYKGISTGMQRPWRRREEDQLADSATPRTDIRYTWFRDWPRDDRGEPRWSMPRHIRYVVDAEGIVLKDERLVYMHGQMPTHFLDWDVELEHPWGMSEIGGIRRIQYTLNRIMGQVMENIILTNRIKVISDTNAVDAKTWTAITQNPNGVYIRKRQGNALSYELPNNAVPPYVLEAIRLLMQSIDVVTGMAESVGGGSRSKGGGANISGVALDNLQIQAQSVIRMEARAFESWLERIFQQVLPLVAQYFPATRLMHLVGPSQELLQFEVQRAELLRDDGGNSVPKESAWQDFLFKILPASSLSLTRVQKGVMASNLYQMGLLPGEDVLRAAEWANPAETVARAREEFSAGKGPGQRTSRKMQKMPGSSRRQAVGV